MTVLPPPLDVDAPGDDHAGCWADPCARRRPGPQDGPEVGADPLGLCADCRAAIVP